MIFVSVYECVKSCMTQFYGLFCSVCPIVSTRSSLEESDADMAAIDAYEPDEVENIEKSLTNVNVVLSTLTQQHQELSRSYIEYITMFNKQQQIHHEELTRSYQEFSANFNKQQQLLFEEMNLLKIEVTGLRKALKKDD